MIEKIYTQAFEHFFYAPRCIFWQKEKKEYNLVEMQNSSFAH